jgi:hypothetical protein
LGISEITLQIHRTHIMRKMAATLDISLSESNVEPIKQFGMRKNVVRSYDCSLAGEALARNLYEAKRVSVAEAR